MGSFAEKILIFSSHNAIQTKINLKVNNADNAKFLLKKLKKTKSLFQALKQSRVTTQVYQRC
jgi:hypothetical protein